MENQNEIMKRYYRGETTVEEERLLKAAFRQKNLPEEPVLAFAGEKTALPPDLSAKIQERIRRRHCTAIRRITAGSIAASLLLLVSLHSLRPGTPDAGIQLSDNLKKERFEDALRLIGKALDDKTQPERKVLYEDHNLIIAVE